MIDLDCWFPVLLYLVFGYFLMNSWNRGESYDLGGGDQGTGWN
jgi:hypothetical protein